MKPQDVTITTSREKRYTIKPAVLAELEKDAQRVADPQDLEDGLLAVAYEEAHAKMAADLRAVAIARAMELLTGSTCTASEAAPEPQPKVGFFAYYPPKWTGPIELS
jgi:hypothetical protein